MRISFVILVSVLLCACNGRGGSSENGRTPQNSIKILLYKAFGTANFDQPIKIKNDGQGNVWILGEEFLSYTAPSTQEISIRKYTSDGTSLFVDQFGAANKRDEALDLHIDSSGSAWILGSTYGVVGQNLSSDSSNNKKTFIAKYSPSGVQEFAMTLGRSENSSNMALDNSGNAWVVGTTEHDTGGASLGSGEVFVFKFDTDGNVILSRNVGTALYDSHFNLKVDQAGNAWILGYTEGNLGGAQQGHGDSFVSKLAPNGTIIFSKNIGSPDHDRYQNIAFDSLGDAYITGYNLMSEGPHLYKIKSDGTILFAINHPLIANLSPGYVFVDSSGRIWTGGSTYSSNDAFYSVFDSSGELLLSRTIGTPLFDSVRGFLEDASGNVFVKSNSFTQGANLITLTKLDRNYNIMYSTDLASHRDVNFDPISGMIWLTGSTQEPINNEEFGNYDGFIMKIRP